MINLVTLCALVIGAPSAPSVTRSASWSDVALAGGVAAAFFTVHAQDEPFFDWRWEDTPRDKPFQEDTVPTTAIYAWSGALTAAAALEGGSKEAISAVHTFSLTGLVTELLKYTAGRPRPDYNDRLRVAAQRGDSALLRDAKLSFPSGHSSTAFALALHTGRWLHRAGCRRGWSRLAIASGYLVPMALAAGTGWTRVTDHRHNLSDVVAGAVIGLGVSYGINRWHFGSTQVCEQP